MATHTPPSPVKAVESYQERMTEWIRGVPDPVLQ